MSELTVRVARGGAYMLLSLVIVRVLNLLNSIVIGRTLGPESMGVYSILLQALNFMTALTVFGVPTVIPKLIAEYRVQNNKGVSSSITVALGIVSILVIIIAVLLSLLAPLIASRVYQRPELVSLFRLLAGLLVLFSLRVALRAILRGFQEISVLAIVDVVSAVILLLANLLLVARFGVPGMVWSMALASGFTGIWFARVLVRRLRLEKIVLRQPLDWVIVNRAIVLMLPVLLTNGASMAANWLAGTYLVRLTDFESAGFLQVANTLTQPVIFIPMALAVPLLPVMAELEVIDSEKLSKVFSRSISVVALLVLPFSLTMGLFARSLVPFLYGPAYVDAWKITLVMAMAHYILAIDLLIGTTMAGLGKLWQAFFVQLATVIAPLLCAFVFIQAFGLIGLGILYCSGYLASTLIQLIYLHRRHGLRWTQRRSILAFATVNWLLACILSWMPTNPSVWFMKGVLACGIILGGYRLLDGRDRSFVKSCIRTAIVHVQAPASGIGIFNRG